MDCGVFALSGKDPIEKRLYQINHDLECVLQKHRPHDMAIEKVFFGKNPNSAFALGQAFAMALYQAHKWSLGVFQYSARSVKKTVTGQGGADKESVYYFVHNILKMKKKIQSLDASDALAVALCHAYHSQNKINHEKSKWMMQNLKGSGCAGVS